MTFPRRMHAVSRTLLALALGLALLPFAASAGEAPAGVEPAPVETPDPAPSIVVHVPSDEMDVLLDADRRGIVLRHGEYERLLTAARLRTAELGARPPVDGALLSAEGLFDLAAASGPRLAVTYKVEVLAPGLSVIPFIWRGLALDHVEVAGEGRYEELDGQGRLRFDGPGVRTVEVVAYASPSRKGQRRLVDVHLPAAAAMALDVQIPTSVAAAVEGEGCALCASTGPDATKKVAVRPSRQGRLRVAWQPAARGEEGPPLLDVQTNTLHTLEDGLVRSRILVHVDALRTPIERVRFDVPANLAVRAVTGKHVTGSARSDDRKTLVVDLDAARRGRLTLTLDGETPYVPRAGLELPRVVVQEAVRQRGTVGLDPGPLVRVHDVRVEGGRRLASQRRKGSPPLLRYALAQADGQVVVDLVPSDLRLEASSTYYLNLTEPAKTLIAALTYRVVKGTAFDLLPRFAPGYALRTLLVNGQAHGFGYDARDDGVVEVRLARGVKEGGRIELTVVLEQARVDWVPDQGPVEVPFAVPSASAAREEGFVGVGADASFSVLDAGLDDLVPVGAAQLTSRGVSPAGLVYGYRLDGGSPRATLRVERRTPRVEATVVTHARPTPRRLYVENVVFHRIERAGVRRLYVDAPTWARDVLRIDALDLVASNRLEDAPADVPAGYDRWEVVLARRVLGRHVVVARYWEDQDMDDWSVPADRPLAVRIPLERVERSVVVARAGGLEVALTGDAPVQDLAELPPEARVDALAVRDVVRLTPELDGPGITVKKHDGAPVLEAVAPHVALETAVAPEGILRTRARVVLVNVGLQYLEVVLPRGSQLIGAVVDSESVKPLSSAGRHRLLIPIPPARRQGTPTVALLTYETRLGREAEGDVPVPAPEFPGLEVVKTTHRVAFDPGVEVQEIRGDYGRRDLAQRAPEPWLAQLLGSTLAAGRDLAPASGARYASDAQTVESEIVFEESIQVDRGPTAAPNPDGGWQAWNSADGDVEAPAAVQDARRQVEVTRGGGMQQRAQVEAARTRAEQESLAAALQHRIRLPREQPSVESSPADRADQELHDKLAALQRLGEDLRRVRVGQGPAQAGQNDAPAPKPAAPPQGVPTVQRSGRAPQYRGPGNAVPPSLREPTDPSPPPPPPSTPPSRAPATPAETPPPMTGAYDLPAVPGAVAPLPQGGGGQPGRPAAGGEGPGPQPEPVRMPPRAGRRKGLLSLDVPVLLSPNVVSAGRLGGGGVMTVTIVPRKAIEAGYWFGVILTLTLGLVLGRGRRAGALLLPLFGFLIALLVRLVFGDSGARAAVAIADGATAVLVVFVLRWLVRWIFFRPHVSKQATVAALLVVAFVLSSPPAQADEIETPEAHEAPDTVYVPYDPDDPDVPRADDRVFLPLDTYLRLRRLAHPDEDPDVLAKGRVVAVLGAEHRIQVGMERAEGEICFRFTKRGAGLSLLPLPLGGAAVVQAMLDGNATPLLLEQGVHHLPIDEVGDHTVRVLFRVPVEKDALGRRLRFEIPPHAAARMDVVVDDFDGDVVVEGAGRVTGSVMVPGSDGFNPTFEARVFLGGLSTIQIALEDPQGAEPEVPLRTRVESHVVHSIRDGGTETRALVTLHVLQGEARVLDIDIPEDVSVLSAGGKTVSRWETTEGRLRLVFSEPQKGRVQTVVALTRAAATPAREETLPPLTVRDTTGERGVVVVNADPFLRVEPVETRGLLRTATPRDKNARGPDSLGRVAGAWHFSARPTTFTARIEEAPAGLSIESSLAVAFGDDRVRSRFDATVEVDARVPVGDLVFDLPGEDEIRTVTGQGVRTWWVEGTGDARTLRLRYADLQRGRMQIRLQLERRLGGKRDAVLVPRWRLRGAKQDRGQLVIFALSDVDPDAGRLPGLRSMPLTEGVLPASPVADATPRRAFRWEQPTDGSIPVTLRTPSLEVDAVVITSLHPGDEVHRLEHLVLFDIRRGATERFDVFVPDAGFAALDVVRTRDLREIRRRAVVRRGPDDQEVKGTLYEVRVQAPREGIAEVTISQMAGPDAPIRVVRPEQVAGEGGGDEALEAVRYFGLVRTFLDGEVDVTPVGAPPDRAELADLPFLPTGLERQDVVEIIMGRSPYVLRVEARRHRLQAEADAVVRAAQADVVLGRDGHARVRVTWRLFNRRRQFLRVQLPTDAVLFGVTVAGRPVKPLEGEDGSLMVPVPKVPLGGAGYPVALLYRAPAGESFPTRDLDVALPEVEGVVVDRTVVRLYVPDGYDVAIESDMLPTEAADVAADLAEAAVREAKDLIDVAKSGTLEQRQRAASNLGVIVAEANELNERAGNKRVALGREVQQVQQEFDENFKSIVEDLEAAGREAQVAQLEFFAGNAAPILESGVQVVPTDQTDLGVRAAQQGQARWAWNPTQVGEAGTKQEIAQLKKRLGKAFEKRQAEEVQDVEIEIAQTSQAGNLIMGDGREVAPDETWANFARLNGLLAQDQGKNRQLGVMQFAGDGNNDAGVDFRGLGGYAGQTIANLDDVTNGLEDMASAGYDHGGTGLAQGAALNPSSGVYFNDSSDGDFRARTENLMGGFGFTSFGQTEFVDREGDGFFTDRVPALQDGYFAEGRTRGQTRSGLMGVDVALPTDGQVFHFRAARGGAPLKIAVTETGVGGFVRWLVFLFGLALLSAGLFTVRRWLSRRAATA